MACRFRGARANACVDACATINPAMLLRDQISFDFSWGFISAQRGEGPRGVGQDMADTERTGHRLRGEGPRGVAVFASGSRRRTLSLGPAVLDLSPPSRGEVKISRRDVEYDVGR